MKIWDWVKTNKKKIIKGGLIVTGLAIGTGVVLLLVKGDDQVITEMLESGADTVLEVAEEAAEVVNEVV